MARIDDYVQARKIAVEALSSVSFEDLVRRSGFETLGEDAIRIPFLDRNYRVRAPEFEFCDEAREDEVPIQEQVLILHYLMAEGPPDLTGNWIAYREIEGASFYFSAFVKRAINPLKKVFGQNIPALLKAAGKIDAQAIDFGDASFEIRVFPKVPLQLILWEGDDEFQPEANILFDETIGDILSPEDVAWLAGMVVYRLMALAR